MKKTILIKGVKTIVNVPNSLLTKSKSIKKERIVRKKVIKKLFN